MSSSHQNRLTFIDVARTYAILLALLSHVFAATGFFQQLGSDALLIRQFTRMATPLFMFMFGFMNEYFAPWNIVTCFIHRGKCDSDAGRREGRFHESVRFCDPVFAATLCITRNIERIPGYTVLSDPMNFKSGKRGKGVCLPRDGK